MGRKKAVETKGMQAETSLRAVRLELPEDVHALLRIAAAKKDLSLAAMARQLVEKGLKEDSKS